MIAKWGIWAALAAVIVVALMFGTVANSVAVSPPVTTYTVTVTQSGIPSTISWSAQVNGVTQSGKGTSMTFTGVPAGSYYVYTYTTAGSSTSIQYVPYTSYTYITVPNTVSATLSFTTQYYTTFSVSPTSSGTAYPGTAWYNAGSEIALSTSAAAGYSFSKWSAAPKADFTFGSTKTADTEVQVNGVGTITATFKSSSSAATFDETGLPASTSWGVTFDSAGSSGTGTSITTGSHTAGSYSWSVAPVSVGTTVQYAPFPASGTMTLPLQPTQEIVFLKETLVTFVTSPSSTGTISPNGATYLINGTTVPIEAYNSASWIFSKWSGNESKVGLGSTSSAGTNATVKASTTITATFKSGSECTTCSLTYTELGLPTGASWGVTFGSLNYPTSTASVTISGITAGNSWAAFEPVSAGTFGVAYIPTYIGTTYTGSGYWSLGSTANIEIVYLQFAWVSVVVSPSSSGIGDTQASGWYAVGSTYALSAVSTAYWSFSSWTSSGKNLTLGSTTASSTTMTVKGPATLTVNAVQPTKVLHFQEFGLPKGTTWGVTLNLPAAVWYTSNTPWVNITGVGTGGYGWTPLTNIYGGVGDQWMPWSYYGQVYLPYTTSESVVYAEQSYLSFATSSNTGGGTTTPSASAWFWVGQVLPIIASNGATTPNFVSWSDTTGTGTISSTSSAATFVTIAGSGTVTAKY